MAEQIVFRKATKDQAYLRLANTGPSGSGKTWTSLLLAMYLVDNPKIVLVDTEHGSASKYADEFEFDVFEMHPPFHPERFVAIIDAAVANNYDVIILDSLSHAWQGTGGVLDMVNQYGATSKGGNYAAWGKVTPYQNALVDTIIRAPIHVIATMRSKQDYSMERDAQGKMRVTKLGMGPIQRDGFEYEFDVVLDMDMENVATVNKTRCPAITGLTFDKPGKELAYILREWLTGEKRSERLIEAIAAQPNGLSLMKMVAALRPEFPGLSISEVKEAMNGE